jgi:hypothetical protein
MRIYHSVFLRVQLFIDRLFVFVLNVSIQLLLVYDFRCQRECSPRFHLLGFAMSVSCLFFGATYALPLVKNYPPTPKQLVANLQVQRINKMASVPIFLEQLSLELEQPDVAALGLFSRIEWILFGGASLPDEICSKLLSHGANLLPCYGSTETVRNIDYTTRSIACAYHDYVLFQGIAMMKSLDTPNTRWKWMKIPECRKPFMKFRPDDHVVGKLFDSNAKQHRKQQKTRQHSI